MGVLIGNYGQFHNRRQLIKKSSSADLKKLVSCQITLTNVGFERMTAIDWIDADQAITFGSVITGNFVALSGSASKLQEYHSGWGKKW